MIKAVLLDLDGTLLDTAPEIAAAANAMLAAQGLAPLPPAAIRDFIGSGAPGGRHSGERGRRWRANQSDPVIE